MNPSVCIIRGVLQEQLLHFDTDPHLIRQIRVKTLSLNQWLWASSLKEFTQVLLYVCRYIYIYIYTQTHKFFLFFFSRHTPFIFHSISSQTPCPLCPSWPSSHSIIRNPVTTTPPPWGVPAHLVLVRVKGWGWCNLAQCVFRLQKSKLKSVV